MNLLIENLRQAAGPSPRGPGTQCHAPASTQINPRPLFTIEMMPPREKLRCFVGLALLVRAVAPLGACNGPAESGPGSLTQIQQLQDKIEGVQRRLVTKDDQIQAQAHLIRELQDLTGERTLDRLVHVSRIELDRLSGGVDDDGDGVDEGVKVYLYLVDQDGDKIKATGSVKVRLLDLANPPDSQLVGEVELSPEELRPMWFGRFLTSHYTIKVPWARGAKHAEHKTITLLVSFTDLLSGQSFETQKAVDVRGVARAGPD